MKVTEKLLVNFYSEIIQYLESIKKLTEKDVEAKKYYKQLGKYLYDAEISGMLSDDESTQKEFLDLFRRLHTIANDILDMDLGTSFKDASDFYDNFKIEQLLEEKLTIDKIYCDINEVLADTDTPDLDWTDDGRKLWEYLFMTTKPVTLLSSTSNQEHKEKWIKNTFAPQFVPPVIFRSSGDKHEFSEPGALLIDNKESTIDEWREKGGIGILHDNSIDTIKELKKYGL